MAGAGGARRVNPNDEAPRLAGAEGFEGSETTERNGTHCVPPPAVPAMASDWHRVGAGLSVRFAIASPGRLEAEWRPRVPTRREFRRVIDRYRTARTLFLAELQRRTGRNVYCLELVE